MGLRSIKINQANMYCQHCFNNVVRAISKIEGISYLDINMNDKTIKIEYEDENMTKRGIRQLINKAITTGKIN